MTDSGRRRTVLHVQEPAWTPEQLGAWLKKRREELGLSHDKLGARVGKGRPQLIDYEKGRHDPSGTTLVALFHALGIRLEPEPPDELPKSVASELRLLRERIDVVLAQHPPLGVTGAGESPRSAPPQGGLGTRQPEHERLEDPDG